MKDKQADKRVDDIIAKLKAIRLEKELSHEKLADKTGLHRSTISLIESRKRQPTLLSCIKIADALEVDLANLMNK